jgi:hypothetical protein
MLGGAKRRRDESDESWINNGSSKRKLIEDSILPQDNTIAYTSIHNGIGFQLSGSANVQINGDCNIGASGM